MLKIVKTENGLVRGLAGNNARISVFKGIPYAAPPVGRNRWRAPRPAQNWDGIKDAFSFAPISIQDTPGLGDDIYCREFHVDSQIEMSEDCLYVNVWTPALSESDNLPVLVWFFGGGFQWGYPSEMEFNGEIEETPPARARIMTGISCTFFLRFRTATILSGSG